MDRKYVGRLLNILTTENLEVIDSTLDKMSDAKIDWLINMCNGIINYLKEYKSKRYRKK